MKKMCCALICSMLLSGQVMAGSPTGMATEATQWLNRIQLGLQYAKQVDQYIMQGLQYETQLKNLILAKSPGITDVLSIINGVGQMMSAGKAIGGSLAQIDRNFANTFKNATAATLAENFTKWNNTSLDTLQGALKSAGKHRDDYPNDVVMLRQLYAKSQATEGARDSIQMLSAINSEAVNQLQKLKDLISAQNIATSTYMANMTDQSIEQINNDKKIKDGFDIFTSAKPVALDTATRTYKPLIHGTK